MRERPKSRSRARSYALQGPRTRVGVREFGESGRRKRRGESGAERADGGKAPRATEQKRKAEQAGLELSRARMVFDDG